MFIRKALQLIAATLILTAATATGQQRAPYYPPFGFDLTGIDRTTKPGDDFFRFASGAYLDRTAIPDDRPTASRRSDMSDRIEAQLQTILEEAAKIVPERPGTTKQKVGAFYASFMDEAAVERIGLDAIKPELSAIRTAPDKAALAELMGKSKSGFYPSPFSAFIDADLKMPARYTTYVGQSATNLPSREYYLSPGFTAQREAYRSYATTLLNLSGWPEAEKAAAAAIAFEARLAEVGWSLAEQRDLSRQYHPMAPGELATFAPGFAWSSWLRGAGLQGRSRLIITTDTALPKLAAEVANAPIDTLKAWMAFRVADRAAPYLPKSVSDSQFAFRGKVIAGQVSQKARWKRAVLAVSGGDCIITPASCFGTMNWAVGQLYAERYFPPQAKSRIDAIASEIKASFRDRIAGSNWMSSTTKKEAIRKLDSFIVKVGYPDRWRDYSNVVIRRGDLIGNVRSAAAADWAFELDKDGEVDRGEWAVTPQTNQAYQGNFRDIGFTAAFLQAPMFDAHADAAINFGSIGAIIGHELSHGFDDQGRTIDADGALRDWWAPADDAAFRARSAALGRQFAQYEPVPGTRLNASFTMGENIADLGGLAMALDAYHASLQGRAAPVLNGLTGDQRFFLGWAQMWAGKTKPEELRRLTLSDPHSDRKSRTNGIVRNIDAWYQAFAVERGDELYLAPPDRALIW
jgi:putative endopeptidase